MRPRSMSIHLRYLEIKPGPERGWGSVACTCGSVCQSTIQRLVELEVAAQAVLRTGGGREAIFQGSSGAIDLANGNTQTLLLTGNTTVSLTGALTGVSCSLSLYILQNATGGWSITWPASVLWPGGTDPTLSSGSNDLDLIVLDTLDGGTTWRGNLAGLNYS